MYGWIFRHLPGPTWLKIIETLIITSLVVFALFQWGFPLLHDALNNDLTVSN